MLEVDRGCRGQKMIGSTNVIMQKNLTRESRYLKKKREERCRSRSGVEGLISHLKLDHRRLLMSPYKATIAQVPSRMTKGKAPISHDPKHESPAPVRFMRRYHRFSGLIFPRISRKKAARIKNTPTELTIFANNIPR